MGIKKEVKVYQVTFKSDKVTGKRSKTHSCIVTEFEVEQVKNNVYFYSDTTRTTFKQVRDLKIVPIGVESRWYPTEQEQQTLDSDASAYFCNKSGQVLFSPNF